MSKINSFEDINAWQKGREFNKLLYQITENDIFIKVFDLKKQIRRASISITSNIAEGFERNTDKEFVYFLYVAKASAGEVRSQLYLAFDLGYIGEDDFLKLKEQIENISKMLSGLIKYLNITKA
ncbi:four helix bundle protein [Cellulophaga sp. Hel_I_12]|uniref:four helix bundle protein n=1 Tax=Cellulophaga sp. Hel_I_12 TaxID=1249972 RepID=UPI000647FF21|nr:four helix bundle protein [Cellulophaga sp. Hel_I_12]